MSTKLRFVVDGDEMIRYLESSKEKYQEMAEALQWYRDVVSECNRHGSYGDVARDLLAKDRGNRAAKALELNSN